MMLAFVPLLITYFLGSIAVVGLLHHLFSKIPSIKKIDYLAISLLISPTFISVIVYYLLLLLPNQQSSFYVFSIVGIILLIIFANQKKIRQLQLFNFASFSFSNFKQSIKNRGEINFILMVYLFFITLMLIINSSLNDHDWYEYGALGKSFYNSLQIAYDQVRYYPQNGFYFIGLHGFAVPLFKTFEEFCNDVFNYKSDFYFRSISYIQNYILFYWIVFRLSKKSALAAFTFIIILVFNAQAFSTIYALNSIDPIRISLIMVVLFLLYKTQGDMNKIAPMIFGSLAGIAAFVHSLSMLMMLGMVGLIVISNLIKYKNLHSFTFACKLLLFFFVFGALHYLLDLTIGTGWIFQNIKFY
jgi:hypothetical protein